MKISLGMMLFFAAIAALFAPAWAHAADADAVVGIWSTQERDARIEIYRCGIRYCGKIAWLAEPDYPPGSKEGPAGQPKTDRNNPNPSLRNRTLLGLPFIENFSHTDGRKAWENGRIYNPEDGKWYQCTITPAGNRLLLRGYFGISLLGRTEVWTRSNLPNPRADANSNRTDGSPQG